MLSSVILSSNMQQAEGISLLIVGLPGIIHLGEPVTYFVVVQNDSSEQKTLVVKSNQDDLVYPVTVPPQSYVEVAQSTIKYEQGGDYEITYVAMKGGNILSAISQTLKVRMKYSEPKKTTPETQGSSASSWGCLLFITIPLLLTILAFTGVKPLDSYKDNIINSINGFFDSLGGQTITTSSSIPPTAGSREFIEHASFLEIDQYVLNTPASAESSIENLAAYLGNGAKDDLEKTRAIYRWITENINYDYQAYLAGTYGDMSAQGVLNSRKSVCAGYSELFFKLAQAMDLQVIKISGWAKGISYVDSSSLLGIPNHAWNAVKLYDGWYLLDSTWGAGSIRNEVFVKEFKDYYFLTNPEQLIMTHYPDSSKWQLTEQYISQSIFNNYPTVYFKVFGSKLITPINKYLEADSVTFFKLVAPGALDVSIVNNGKWHYLTITNSIFEGSVPVTEGGVDICAKYSKDSNTYSVIVSYVAQ